MIIAVPVVNKQLSMHFGHCEIFSFYEVDESNKKIVGKKDVEPPPHEPDILPKWIKEQGATIVLSGGMGRRAQDLFFKNGVQVIVGVSESSPEKAVLEYLNKRLKTSENTCDH